ncbi:conserved hypothetical protein [Pediculus humanus corporis]|uniref:HAUS augmin-like complex subunit 3 N-terminal domain-containing protein n=1 Tax=Pediculus humanus subsp. corporis TaxID=121224 RepID=E0VAR5_PEDHC|nr:uncharacterized protein Phum_PHUM043230 [Pediculus humanus corporis]EEB10471.1 conserved hypothetical protein [Pediculus humanus corporis]
MALSVQNKNFLSLLSAIDIDLNQFPDKSFDGLFENVPEDISFFFDWIIDNITSENALTKVEEMHYFELEKNNMVPSLTEVDFVLSTNKISFDELQTLDADYISNLMVEDLEDLKETNRSLNDVLQNIAQVQTEVNKIFNKTAEKNNFWKNELNIIKEKCYETNELFDAAVENLNELLLKEPNILIQGTNYQSLLEKENGIFCNIDNYNLPHNENFHRKNQIQFLNKMEENLKISETLLALSKGIKNYKDLQKESVSFIDEYKTHCINNVRNFELKEQKFNETLKENGHSFLNEINDLLIDLFMVFQKCVEKNDELSRKIKRLLNKYLEAKTLVRKSDRKNALLWIDFVTNSGSLQEIMKKYSRISSR